MRPAPIDGPFVVCSVLPAGAGDADAAIARAPAGCALVELRADRLRPEEIGAVVARSPRALIVTCRTRADGGEFEGSEEERARGLRAALRAGARAIDVEWDRPLAAELAAEAGDGARLILSHHGGPCRDQPLRAVYRRMSARPAARLKIVPEAKAVAENGAVRALLARARAEGRSLACFASGRAGAVGRLLAPSWGSWATYGAVGRGAETAAGQLTAREMLETFDVLAIGPGTRLFGLVGARVGSSPSPAMHAAGYRASSLDARYLAVEAERFEDFLGLLEGERGIPFEAFAVTVPFKERAARDCLAGDETSAVAGAVNTVLRHPGGPVGYNTDGAGALDCIASRIDPRGCSAAILGAGGTGRAVAHALLRAGARVVLFNRDLRRAEQAARRLGCGAAALADLGRAAWDILVHATPQGGDGERFLDPALLRGRVVLDAVYAPRPTALVADARERGLVAIDGAEMLAAQGARQFERMTGRTASRATFRAEAVQHLERSAP